MRARRAFSVFVIPASVTPATVPGSSNTVFRDYNRVRDNEAHCIQLIATSAKASVELFAAAATFRDDSFD